MKQFNLNTPKNLPRPSPVFTIQQVYSPFMSPYALPIDMGGHVQRRQEDDDFGNFELEQRQPEVPQQPQQEQPQPPYQMPEDSDDQPNHHLQSRTGPHDSKVRTLVELLVMNVDRSEERLNEERQKCIGPDDHDLKEVYDILLKKFKKLKKTKEQMTKYCMRKAFKYLSEKLRKQNPSLNKEADIGLKHYFSGFEQDDNFTIPFKKNSHQKTMNTNFLKKVFSSQPFLIDYLDFLKSFRKLVEEDNTKKIKYLSETIQTHLSQRSVKKLQTIKRLPWTQNILEKTQDLAEKLAQHSPYQPEATSAIANSATLSPIIKRQPVQTHQFPPGMHPPSFMLHGTMGDHPSSEEPFHIYHRSFFATTPTLRAASPPSARDEPPLIKRLKIEHQ